MQWHCLETPQPRVPGQPRGSSACPHPILCSSASLVTWRLSGAFPCPPGHLLQRPPLNQAWIHTLSSSGGHLGCSPGSSSQAGAPGPSSHTCWLLTARLCSSLETYPEPVGVPPSQDAQKIINYLPPPQAGPQPVMDGFGVQKPSSLPQGASAVR